MTKLFSVSAVVLALGLVGVKASAGVAFKCQGSKSRFEVVEGYYQGEASDIVVLKISDVYDISNYGVDTKPGQYPNGLYLERTDYGKTVKSGAFRDFPLQFSAMSKDKDLGNKRLVFGIPLGVFGAGIGKQFDAVYRGHGEAHTLSCEVVSSVQF